MMFEHKKVTFQLGNVVKYHEKDENERKKGLSKRGQFWTSLHRLDTSNFQL